MLKFIIVTDLLIPARFDALTIGFVVLVRPKNQHSEPLIAHELVHVKQFWNNPLFYGIRYQFSKKSRFAYEAEAYRTQLALDPSEHNRLTFASFLVNNYRLDITMDQALAALPLQVDTQF